MARLDTATGIALALGGAAFAASFTHVRDVAAAHGQPGWISHAIAVSVELMAIGSGLEIRRRRAHGHRHIWPVATLLLGVAMSLAANLETSGPGVWGKVMAAWPAIAFLAVAGLIETRPTTSTSTGLASAVPPETSLSITRDEPRTVRSGTGTVPEVEDQPSRRPLDPAPRPVPAQVSGQPDRPVQGRAPTSPSPGPVVSPAPELVAFARRVADDHQAAHGRAITRDQLRSRLRISNALAGQLLTALRSPQAHTSEGR
ncbi:MAG: DUF2637 domain-containing protein [Carbonactinosporaceae bacterium]